MQGKISAILLGLLIFSVVILVGALVYFNPPKASSGEVRFEGVTITTADTDGDGVRDVVTMETNDGKSVKIKPEEGEVKTDNLVFKDTDGDGKVDTMEEKNSGRRWRIPGSGGGTGTQGGAVETNAPSEETNANDENEAFFPFSPPDCLFDGTCMDGGGWPGGEEKNGENRVLLPTAIDLGAFKPKSDWIPFGPPKLPENNSDGAEIPVFKPGTVKGVAIDVDMDGKYDMLQKGRQIFFDSDGDGEADTGYEEGNNYDVFIDFGRRKIAVDVGKDGSVNLWKEGRRLCIDLDGDGSCEVEAETDDEGNPMDYTYDRAKLGRFVGPEVLDKLNDPKALEDYVNDAFGDYVDAWDRVRGWERTPPVEMPRVEFQRIELPQLSPADVSDLDRLGVMGTGEDKADACMESVNFIVAAAEHREGYDLGAFRHVVSRQLDGPRIEDLQRRFFNMQGAFRVEEPHLVGRFTTDIENLSEVWEDANAPGRIAFCGRIYGYWYTIDSNGVWHDDPHYEYMPIYIVCDGAGKIYYLYYWGEVPNCFEA